MKSPSNNEASFSLSNVLANSDLREVCRGLTQIIDSHGNQNLELLFKEILEDVFYMRIVRWGLRREGVTAEESLCIREFFGLKGPLFRLMNRMMEHGIQCDGPLRVQYHSDYHDGPTRMSPLEVYFIYFAYDITRPFFTTPDLLLGQDGIDLPYFTLLDEYLRHYFPMSSDVKPPTVNLGMPLKVSPKPYHPLVKTRLLLRRNIAKSNPSFGEPLCCDVLTPLFSNLWMENYFIKIAGVLERKVPTQNHIRAIRVLVKHIHFFYNAHTQNMRNIQNESPFEQINQGIMNKFAPKLFEFLTYCFDVWPRDQSFRIVLETWLSFIQPWRYINNASDTNAIGAVSNVWFSFISTHLKFYSTLFQSVIKRLKCMDLSTSGNSILLFRVAKVFKQPNLILLIDQALEASMQEISQVFSSYVIHPAQVKSLTGENMFSLEFTEVVEQLMDTICQALENLKSNDYATDESHFSTKTLRVLGYGALIENRPERNLASDRNRIKQNLTFSLNFFSETYELPIPDISKPCSAQNSEMEWADHTIDESGKMSLTPLGRYQLCNNLRKFPIAVNTHPDLWPICSYECTFLVRFLYKLTTRFNREYADEIESICNKNGMAGKLARYLLVPQIKSQGRKFKPRVSLRFLADYKILFYLFILYLVSCFFGFSFPWGIFYVLCLVFISIIFIGIFSKET